MLKPCPYHPDGPVLRTLQPCPVCGYRRHLRYAPLAIATAVGICSLVGFGAGAVIVLLTQPNAAVASTAVVPGTVPPTLASPASPTTLQASPEPGLSAPPPTAASPVAARVGPTHTPPAPSPTPRPTATPTSTTRGRIVFTCFDGNDDEICLIGADGASRRQLTDNAVGDFYPSLSADGQFVVYAHQVSGSNYEIYRMRTDGSEVTALTQNGVGNFGPAYSPDGQFIAYTSTQAGGRQQIFVMTAEGANSRRLTEIGNNIDPAWSPDGQAIAFASTRSGPQQIWVMQADGGGQRQLTDLADVGGRNAWSPDGQTLAFYAGQRSNYSRRVYLISVDGGTPRQLPFDSECLGPSFSPDGQWLAFTSTRDGKNEIYIARLDGSEWLKVSAGAISDYQPEWGR